MKVDLIRMVKIQNLSFTWSRKNICVKGSILTRYEATIIADE